MHRPVLVEAVINGLAIKPDGIYVDGTFGRGGHSKEILQRLGPNGRLIALDKDPEAIIIGESEPFRDPRFCIVHSPFAQLKEIVLNRGYNGKINGVLLDLGVSSPQLDEARRGFSFIKDGPLDMRMDLQQKTDAAMWIKSATEAEISNVLFELGEERYSRRIARAIVKAREEAPITRTLQLAEIVAKACPTSEKKKHPATRTFQAIRIYINRELEELRDVLPQSIDVMASGGRLCVISFHSLEDRIVKTFISKETKGRQIPREIPIKEAEKECRLKKVGALIKPSDSEIKINPRARSARLRIAEKIL